LRTVLDFLRKDDVLTVTRIDRLARSIGDLQDIVRTVKARGASLKATEQPIDTGTAAGKCFLDMLGVFAEFETNLRRERQIEGIARAKAEGVYKGRPASIDVSQVRAMKAEGMGATEIPVVWVTVYRSLEVAMTAEAEGGPRGLLKKALIGDRTLTPNLQIATVRIEMLKKAIPLIRGQFASSPGQQSAQLVAKVRHPRLAGGLTWWYQAHGGQAK
jgi:hypothetical protein